MPHDALEVRRPIGFNGEQPYELRAHRAPTYSELNVAMNRLVTERDGEWCGIPMPLPGLGLVLESKYPSMERIKTLQGIVDENETPDNDTERSSPEIAGWRVVNSWHGRTKTGIDGEILILRHEDGRTRWGFDPDKPKRNRMLFGPLETMDAWNIATECAAIDALATMLTERMFKAYALTGGFLETSKRSKLTYWFRRLRPTLVLTPHGGRFGDHDGEMRLLCALCLHPLAYYENSFCGAMTPTDDVIAHLLLMRGDEPLFWRRANQHPVTRPESGV